MGWLVVRAVVFGYREEGLYEASGGRTLFGGERVRVRLRSLVVERVGFLVQSPPSQPRVSVWWEPRLEVRGVGGLLCRYHEGPPGVLEEQSYCTRMAVTRSGFCREHSRSPLALYEACASTSLRACLEVDVAWRDEKYCVYALDYGGQRLKIGLTRCWRLLHRLAEQPHTAAAVVAVHESAYEARRHEIELARRSGASEGTGVRVSERLNQAAQALAVREPEQLARSLAEKLARLGLEGEYEAYTVKPSFNPRRFLESSWTGSPEKLGGSMFRVAGYWAGLLLLEGAKRLVIPKNALLHHALQVQS